MSSSPRLGEEHDEEEEGYAEGVFRLNEEAAVDEESHDDRRGHGVFPTHEAGITLGQPAICPHHGLYAAEVSAHSIQIHLRHT
jgi:hypothetical protein